MVKQLLFVGGCAFLGNMLAERFVLKSTPEDPTGFVVVQDGIGVDDAARALTIAATFVLAKKFLGGMAG